MSFIIPSDLSFSYRLLDERWHRRGRVASVFLTNFMIMIVTIPFYMT